MSRDQIPGWPTLRIPRTQCTHLHWEHPRLLHHGSLWHHHSLLHHGIVWHCARYKLLSWHHHPKISCKKHKRSLWYMYVPYSDIYQTDFLLHIIDLKTLIVKSYGTCIFNVVYRFNMNKGNIKLGIPMKTYTTFTCTFRFWPFKSTWHCV